MFTLVWYPYVLGLPLLAAAWRPARRLIRRFPPTVSMWAWPFGLLYLLNDAAAWVVGKSMTTDGIYNAKVDFQRVELRETIFAGLTALTAYLLLRTVRAHHEPTTASAGEHDRDGSQ